MDDLHKLCPCMICLDREQKTFVAGGSICFVGIWILIIAITFFASLRSLGKDEQLLVNGPEGRYVINGPSSGAILTHPFREKEIRKAIRISDRHYQVIKNARSGLIRHEPGPQERFFLGAWDEDQGTQSKITLQQREYRRMVDTLTGWERIIPGPAKFTPVPLEDAPQGTETAITISAGRSILTLNKTSGVRQLHTAEGLFIPGPYEIILEVRQPLTIGPLEYVTIKDLRTGALTNVPGPTQLRRGAYEVLHGDKKDKLILDKETYIQLVNGEDGTERIVRGPTTMVPGPLEYSRTEPMKKKAVHVSATKAVLTWKATTGERRLVRTEGVFVPDPYEEVLETRAALIIGPKEYAVLMNIRTGTRYHKEGPLQIFVDAYEELISLEPKLALQQGFYTRLVNNKTGTERVLEGPVTVVPAPDEWAPEGEQRAIFVDTETALVILDRATGEKTLYTQTGAFIPNPYETITDTRQLIKVLPSESMVIRDNEGRLTVKQGGGSSDDAAFFLGPYEEVVTMYWSDYSPENADGLNLTKAEVQRIDMRVRTIFFKYEVRTSDNVLLMLEGTIRWIMKDVMKMLQQTGDPEGDIWYRCRSALIKGVSQTTFDDFMKAFNSITVQAFNDQSGDVFYADRGVEVKTFELMKYECVDAEVDAIRQEIIQETTNRINKKQQAESANEVAISELRGQIALEENRNDLLKAQGANTILQARMQGEAYGRQELESVKTFIDLLNTSVTNVDERVEIFKLQEQISGRTKDIANLKDAKARVFMTPKDMSIRMDMTGNGGVN